MLRQTMISICRRHVKKLKDSYLSERVARYLSLLPEVNLAFSIDINHHYYYHNSFTSLSLTRIFHYHWGGIEKQKFSGSPWAISRHILPRRRVSDFFCSNFSHCTFILYDHDPQESKLMQSFQSFQAKPSGRYWKMSFQCWLLVKRQKSLLCTV